jgi:DNA-binding MarR family transcriptional regulator
MNYNLRMAMARTDAGKIWSMTFRMSMSVIREVAPEISALGLETKELFVLAELDEHPHPAELAALLSMPKPTVTSYVKRLEAAGFLHREIDAGDLRRHRLILTPAGRATMVLGLALLSSAFDSRLGRLSAAQRRELADLLKTMG